MPPISGSNGVGCYHGPTAENQPWKRNTPDRPERRSANQDPERIGACMFGIREEHRPTHRARVRYSSRKSSGRRAVGGRLLMGRTRLPNPHERRLLALMWLFPRLRGVEGWISSRPIPVRRCSPFSRQGPVSSHPGGRLSRIRSQTRPYQPEYSLLFFP